MPDKIAFYILPENTLKARDLYACRLVEKAYGNSHHVYIHTTSLAETQNFDVQLWTFRDISFIPHAIYDSQKSFAEKILIGHDGIPQQTDVLVNLTHVVPEFYNKFQHIIELITDLDEERKAGRQRYQFYQQQGHKIETYDLTKKT